MKLRWLDSGEAVDRLNPIIEKQGWSQLNERTVRALVAEDDDGKIIALLVLQMFPILGPEWVQPESRGAGVMYQLHEEMRKFLTEVQARGVMVIADSEVADKLCQREGMRRVENPVYIAASFGPGVN